METFLNLLRIRRVEFRIAEIPLLIMPILLERSGGAFPLTFQAVLEAVLIFGFMFAFGDMINCLADRDLDAVYKKHLSNAVYSLGLPFVILQITLSALGALVIAAHLSWLLDRWLLLALVAVGLLLGAAYSVPPVRLKGRGLGQMICLWLVIFFGPMLFSATLVRPLPSPILLLFAAAYATIQMGVVLVNTAEDYPEDREAGVCNAIVALGLADGVGLAAKMARFGGAALLLLMGILFALRRLPLPWTYALLPLAGTILFVVSDIGSLARRVRQATPDAAVTIVKKTAKRVPVWITLIAWTTLGAVATLYYYNLSLAQPMH